MDETGFGVIAPTDFGRREAIDRSSYSVTDTDGEKVQVVFMFRAVGFKSDDRSWS